MKNERNLSRIMVVFLVVCLIPLSVPLIPLGTSEPVTIEEAYEGSWTDSFDDAQGVSTSENITIENGDAKLALAQTPFPSSWDHVYTADTEPDAVGWTVNENAVGDLASASGGILTLDTTPEDAWWWYIYSWGASNSVGATFEARLKVITSTYAMKIILRDGTYYEGFIFYPDRIRVLVDSSLDYHMDTTDAFHTYRITVKNSDYMVYVDGILRINGTGQHDEATGGNVCTWGDYDVNSGYTGNILWDWVRFNVSGAYPPMTSSYQNRGVLTSTEIILPGQMTWDMLHIDKTEPGTGSFINVSVLDGTTLTPIPGFEDMDNTAIDISSIDTVTYPSIRLMATFIGNTSSTPALHEWQVTWHDTTPPSTPAGLKVSNPMNGYSLILSWYSNSESDLDCYVLYYSLDNASFAWLSNVSANTVSFTHYGLDLGTTYYYKIAAADGVPNQSPFSYVVEGVPDLDYDGDGTGNIADPDDDNDGIADIDDPYPYSDINDMEVTLDNLTIDVGTLRAWLENTMANVQGNINATNETLHQQLAIQEAMMTNFYDNLSVDLGDIRSDLILHDQKTGQNHSVIIALINDILDGQIEKEKIAELRSMLIDLAENLSDHDRAIADDILDVVNDIDAFEIQTDDQLTRINQTLLQLEQLEDVLSDLTALDSSLDQAEENIEDTIDERSTKEEDDERFFVVELLLILVLILLVVNLMAIFLTRRKGEEGPKETPGLKKDHEQEEKPEFPIPPPNQD